MNRRSFIKSSALLAAGAVGASGMLAAPDPGRAGSEPRARNAKPGMQYRPFGQTGAMVSALGFGMMRPPLLASGEPDEARFGAMVRHAIDNGLNYIDTSHVYSRGKNEALTGRILKDGYRDKVYLATKMPWWQIKTADDFERILERQLESLQTDHIDCYLMHAITITGWQGAIPEFKLIQKMEKAKEQGKIRHMGFSFHAPLRIFKEALNATPNWEFCQIQLNYLDTEYQAGLTGMKYAHDRGMGVIAMEPLRGGFLASMPAGAKALFDAAPKKRSDVEWAFDYLWDMPEVSMVLSGMSAMQHVEDNLTYAGRSSVGMLNSAERGILADVVRHLQRDYGAVPCTGCEHCRFACPENVAIVQILIPWNQYIWSGNLEPARQRIAFVHGSTYGNGLQACTDCGKCVPACPQGIDIPQVLRAIRSAVQV